MNKEIYHKPFDGISLYTQTCFGRAREITFEDQKVVYVTPEILEKRARNRAMVDREKWKSFGQGRSIGRDPFLSLNDGRRTKTLERDWIKYGELLDFLIYDKRKI